MAAKLEPTAAFVRLCGGLHQDCFVDALTLEELAQDCLGFLYDEDRPELLAFLERILATRTDGELSHLLRGCAPDIDLRTKSRLFLETVALTVRKQAASKKAEDRARHHSHWSG